MKNIRLSLTNKILTIGIILVLSHQSLITVEHLKSIELIVFTEYQSHSNAITLKYRNILDRVLSKGGDPTQTALSLSGDLTNISRKEEFKSVVKDILIVNSGGIIIGHSNPEQISRTFELPQELEAKPLFLKKSDFYSSLIPILSNNSVKLYVITNFNSVIIDNAILEKIIPMLLRQVFGTVGTIVLLWFSIRFFFVGRLNQLKLELESIETDTSFSKRLKSYGNDEIGILSKAFNKMLSNIEQSSKSIQNVIRIHQTHLNDLDIQVTSLTQQSQQQTEKLTGLSPASTEITVSVIQDNHLPEATQTTLNEIHQNIASLHHSLDLKDEAIDAMAQTISYLSNDFAHIANTLQTQVNTREALGLSTIAGASRDKIVTHELTSSFPESSSLLETVQGLQQQTDHLKTVGLPVLEANLQHLDMLKDPVEYVGMAGKRVKIEDHRDFRFRTLPLDFELGQEVSILVFDAVRDSERSYQQFLNDELIQSYFGCQSQFRYKIIGRQSSVHRIVDIVDDLNPDLVFLDPYIPADTKPYSSANLTHGLKALLDLYKNYETLPVVVLPQHTNPVLTDRCFGLGARGVIPKRHSDWQLSFLLDRVLQNDLVAAGASGLNYMTLAKCRVGLTPEEMNVLDLMALGLTNQEIASTLGKSVNTVRNQITSIRAKLRLAEERMANGFYDSLANI